MGVQAPSPPQPAPVVPSPPSRWTAGRVVSLVLGSLLLVGAVGLGIGAGALALVDGRARDADGFLMSPTTSLSAPGSALVSTDLRMHLGEGAGALPAAVLGDVRVRATSTRGQEVFVGVGPTDAVRRYLDGVARSTVTGFRDGRPVYDEVGGSTPGAPPAQQDFWVVGASGPGTRTVTWPTRSGDWTVVVMNADGSAGVAVEASAGAELGVLHDLAVALAVAAVLALLVGGALFAAPLLVPPREPR